MRINVMCWHKVIDTGVISDGFMTECEVTKEQFKRIEDSYRTRDFEYMSEDDSLSDITAPLIEEGNQDAKAAYKEIANRLTSVIAYPEVFCADCGGIELEEFIKKGDRENACNSNI